MKSYIGKLHKAANSPIARKITALCIFPMLIALICEMLNRRSIDSAIGFMFTKPLVFLVNASIISVSLSITFFLKKRRYAYFLVSGIWLLLGTVNFIVLLNRMTPFSFMDILLVPSIFPILPKYLTLLGCILCGIGIVCAAVALVIVWFKTKKRKTDLKNSIIGFASAVAACAAFILASRVCGMIPARFAKLIDAYKDYGFTYSFSVSVFDRGINKPNDYDEEVKKVVEQVLGSGNDTSASPSGGTSSGDDDTSPPENGKTLPNIVFVQLESFYDLNMLKGFEFAEDPVPNYTALKNSSVYGTLTVPTVGAGTANTEFEVMTGMSLEWFGAGEYPFETILQKIPSCESVCYNLKQHGYSAHAIHNYRAYFYARMSAYSVLGFDTFTPIEYMNGYSENILEWADDKVLTQYVTESLKSTDNQDVVYCVTVQAHGKYPMEEYDGYDEEKSIVSVLPEGANKYGYDYYIDQIRGTDEFIGDLISEIEALGEDTIIVFFGDHIPYLDFKEEWLPEGNTLYDTEYVIWSNCIDIELNRKIRSYQLSAEILRELDIDTGVMTKLHQTWYDKDTYNKYLEMLEYDMLYGKNFSYGCENPFVPTDIKMGIFDITVSGVESDTEKEGSYTVVGERFNRFSRVYINGSSVNTEYIDDEHLSIGNYKLKEGDSVSVIQISNGMYKLDETNKYTVQASDVIISSPKMTE